MSRLVLASASPRRAELLRAAGFEFDVIAADVDEAIDPEETPDGYIRRLAQLKAEAVALQAGGRPVLGADTIVVVGHEVLGKPADAGDARRMLRLLSGREHAVMTAVCLITPRPGQAGDHVNEGPAGQPVKKSIRVGRAVSGPPGEPDRVRPTADDFFTGAEAGDDVRLGPGRAGDPVDERSEAGRDARGGAAQAQYIRISRPTRIQTRVVRTTVEFAPLADAEIEWYVASGEPMDKAGAYAIQGLASRFITRIDGSYSNVVGLPVALVYDLCKGAGLLVS